MNEWMINDGHFDYRRGSEYPTTSGSCLRHEEFSLSFLTIYAIVVGNVSYVPDATF